MGPVWFKELFIGGEEVVEGELILRQAKLTGTLVIVFKFSGDVEEVLDGGQGIKALLVIVAQDFFELGLEAGHALDVLGHADLELIIDDAAEELDLDVLPTLLLDHGLEGIIDDGDIDPIEVIHRCEIDDGMGFERTTDEVLDALIFLTLGTRWVFDLADHSP